MEWNQYELREKRDDYVRCLKFYSGLHRCVYDSLIRATDRKPEAIKEWESKSTGKWQGLKVSEVDEKVVDGSCTLPGDGVEAGKEGDFRITH